MSPVRLSARAVSVRVFVVAYVLLQVALPLRGLVRKRNDGVPVAFSWHMFSVIPRDAQR